MLLLPAVFIVVVVGVVDPAWLTWWHIAALTIGTGVAGVVIESVLSRED
jgi:hypothetical protein